MVDKLSTDYADYTDNRKRKGRQEKGAGQYMRVLISFACSWPLLLPLVS
jgi:hypothetical protein